MSSPYMSGSLVTSTAVFADDNGNPADPAVITLKYKSGSGSAVTVTYPSEPIVRLGEGVYQAALDTTGFGGPGLELWTTQWSGTGNVQAITVSYFSVIPPAL